MTLSLHFLFALAASLTVSVSMVILSPLILNHVQREDTAARQAAHHRPTLRLGGVGILAGLWLATLGAGDREGWLLTLLVLSLPIFVCGLLEDIGIPQSPRRRLGIAAVSGVAVMVYGGVHILRVGIAGVDVLIAFAPFGMAFTIFATAGLVHAFNLVDGLNGMAGAVGVISVAGLAGLGHMAGVDTMEQAAPALLGALAGFLALNFPKGRIFLGDAGAYTIGFIMAWLAVILMHDAQTLSPWAVLLVFFWPVADTLLTIWRRAVLRAPIGQPDRLHFHQVIMRTIEIVILRRKVRRISNPLSTMVALPMMLPPVAAGVVFWDSDGLAATAFAVFATLFVAAYLVLIRHAKRQRFGARRNNTDTPISGGIAHTGVHAEAEVGR